MRLERASALICELVGGAPGPLQQLEQADQLPKAANLVLRAKQLRRLLGTDVPHSGGRVAAARHWA